MKLDIEKDKQFIKRYLAISNNLINSIIDKYDSPEKELLKIEFEKSIDNDIWNRIVVKLIG